MHRLLRPFEQGVAAAERAGRGERVAPLRRGTRGEQRGEHWIEGSGVLDPRDAKGGGEDRHYLGGEHGHFSFLTRRQEVAEVRTQRRDFLRVVPRNSAAKRARAATRTRSSSLRF